MAVPFTSLAKWNSFHKFEALTGEQKILKKGERSVSFHSIGLCVLGY
jgi:hypothetical protein